MGLGSEGIFVSIKQIEWDPTNKPLSKLLELLDTQVFSGSIQWVLSEISWMVGAGFCFHTSKWVSSLLKK